MLAFHAGSEGTSLLLYNPQELVAQFLFSETARSVCRKVMLQVACSGMVRIVFGDPTYMGVLAAV